MTPFAPALSNVLSTRLTHYNGWAVFCPALKPY